MFGLFFISVARSLSLTRHFAWIQFFTWSYRRSNESYRTVHVLDEHSTHETDTHFQNGELKLENTNFETMAKLWKTFDEKWKIKKCHSQKSELLNIFVSWIFWIWIVNMRSLDPYTLRYWTGWYVLFVPVCIYVYINRCRWGFNVFPESGCDLKLLCFGCGKHR